MTNRRSHLTLVGLLLAALAGVAALAIPGSPVHKKVNLGLDLQGGLEVVLQAQPQKGQKLDKGALDRSVSTSGNPVETTDLYGLLKKIQAETKRGEPAEYYAFGKKKTKPVGPGRTAAEARKLATSAKFKKPITV